MWRSWKITMTYCWTLPKGFVSRLHLRSNRGLRFSKTTNWQVVRPLLCTRSSTQRLRCCPYLSASPCRGCSAYQRSRQAPDHPERQPPPVDHPLQLSWSRFFGVPLLFLPLTLHCLEAVAAMRKLSEALLPLRAALRLKEKFRRSPTIYNTRRIKIYVNAPDLTHCIS